MTVTATIPAIIRSPGREEAAQRKPYALSFGSTSARVWLSPRSSAGGAAKSVSRGFTESDMVCGMLGARAELLARLWKEGFISELMDTGLLAAAEPYPGCGYPFALRLSRTPAISYGTEWSGEMWRVATLAVIDLLATLARRNLTLRYPNPWYLLFDGPKPVYVNAGAIAPLDEAAHRSTIDRLARSFLHPLNFCARGQGRVARTLLRSLYGIRQEDFAELRELEPGRRHELDRSTPVEFLTRLRTEVENTEFPEPARSSLGHRADLPLKPCDRWSQKHWAVYRQFKELRPTSVLDLACGTGWCARLAGMEAAEVVAASLDEPLVDRLHRQSHVENGHVLPLLLDVVDPTPGLGMCNAWFPPATERLRADLVLALDIVHHLVLSGLRLTFDQVAEACARFTNRWLLVEFVPLGSDDNPYSRGSAGATWYELDRFVRALQRQFPHVSVLSGSEQSELLLCEK